MKKFFSALLALTLMVCTVAFAADYKISVPETDQMIENTYDETVEETDVTLLVATAALGLTDSRGVMAQLKVESGSEKPVAVILKLEIPEEKQAEGSTAIDYMNFAVKSSDGTALFDEEENREKGVNSREITLGVLNEDGKAASETYDIYISANEELKMAYLANQPGDVEWTLVLNSDDAVVAESKNVKGKTITITVDKATDKDGGKVAAGVYGFMGKGVCTIKSTDGKRDLNFELSDKEEKAKYITLKQGDIITITGGADAKLELLSPTTSTTTTTAKTTKKNPKTGDNAPITLAAVVALSAMALMVYTTRTNKRED